MAKIPKQRLINRLYTHVSVICAIKSNSCKYQFWTKPWVFWLNNGVIVMQLSFSTDVNNKYSNWKEFLYKLVIKIPPDYASIRTISSLPSLLVFCIQRCCRIRRVISKKNQRINIKFFCPKDLIFFLPIGLIGFNDIFFPIKSPFGKKLPYLRKIVA